MKTEDVWPKLSACAMCGGEFLQHRPQHQYCKDGGCQKSRQKQRWDTWRQRREADGTYRDKVNGYQQGFRQRTGYARDYELRTKYGISLDQWLDMVAAVSGRCEICGTSDEVLCVDHDHATGKIRGVLCKKCNRALGQLGDSEELLLKAIRYLRKASDELMGGGN